ncbi:MAG TPA: DUF4876 domain-containing protein [Solirubrobacteraceae bacterium]|nr:DUF4876 domain-containing protein [Solirubrobacteraceae bacterium]
MALVAVVACQPSLDRVPTAPGSDTSATDTTHTGGVARLTLAITVNYDQTVATTAQALGWPAGRVPGAVVKARRGSDVQIDSGVTDDSGRVAFTGLLTGGYNISVERVLSAAERAKLPAGDGTVALGGGLQARSDTAATLHLPALVYPAARGGLVVSEIFPYVYGQPNGDEYFFRDFIEIYNAADTVVPLAGKLVFEPFAGWFDYPTRYNCAAYAQFMGDTLGLWAQWIFAFPQDAAALAPGARVVIATDAIDHTKYAQGTVDLSHADYEFLGDADVDNPAVPNMVSVGPRPGDSFSFGHGFYFYEIRDGIAVGNAMDVGALPITRDVNNLPWVRIPRDDILDLVTFRTQYVNSSPDCRMPVPTDMDAAENRSLPAGDYVFESIARRLIGYLPDGRPILLKTHNSSIDFIAQEPTPGTIP